MRTTICHRTSRTVLFIATVTAVAVAGLLACGSESPGPIPPAPTPTPVPPPIVVNQGTASSTIGPEGGSVDHPSGARIIVPVGALAAPTRLSLTGIAPPTADTLHAIPLGQSFEAGPEGQTFLKPVTVILPFDPTRVPPNQDAKNAQVHMAPRGTKLFDALDSNVDLGARLIRTATVHFTEFVPAQNPNPVFITTPSPLPSGTVGSAYSTSFAASGGATPYAWSVASGSVLPPGLSLTTGGALGGTPTIPFAFGFFVRAQDANARAVQKAFEMTVAPATNPAPTLTAINPSAADQGSGTTTIALTGTGFVPTSSARWDGTPIATTFVSTTELAAAIPMANLTASGTHQVSVFSPPPGGGTSGSVTFTVNAVAQNPVPAITSVDPTFLPVSATDAQISITGSNFLPTSSAAIGGQGISTSYVSSTALLASIPASFLAAPGTLPIGVWSPSPGGGFSTSTVNVTVGALNPVPAITSLSPSSITAGSADFTLTVLGTSFASGATIFFNGTSLSTNVVSTGSAVATVPASLITTAGSASVLIVNPTPGGGASGSATFTIQPLPATCLSTPVVDPTTTIALPLQQPAGTFGCTSTAAIGTFELTQPTHFAMYYNRPTGTLPNAGATIQLRAGCGTDSTLIEQFGFDCSDTHYRVLQPGRYTFVRCLEPGLNPRPFGEFIAEAVPPPGTPTVRMWDGTTVLTQQINLSTAGVDFWVRNLPGNLQMRAGSFRVQVRTVCNDPSTNIYSTGGSMCSGSPAQSPSVPFETGGQSGVHCVVVDQIDQGLLLQISSTQ